MATLRLCVVKTVRVHAALMVTLGVMLSSQAMAQTRLAEQAINCAAVFTIFSQVYASNPTLAAKFAKVVDIFHEVYLKERPQDSSEAGDVVKRSNSVVQEFRQTWTARSAYFRENAVICGAWAEGFLGQAQPYQFVPVYPKVVAPSVRLQYQAHADQAIQHWQP